MQRARNQHDLKLKKPSSFEVLAALDINHDWFKLKK